VITEDTPLLLGSASPRRRDILRGIGLPLTILPADVEEDVLSGELPLAYLERVVGDKLSAVAERALRDENSRFGALLVADTIVVLGTAVLGKPLDDLDAQRLLGQLSGRTHIVYTRYAISLPGDPGRPRCARTVETEVTMRLLADEVIARYVATGEGRDKAGSYAAQGIGASLIRRIEGSYTNVVGLPACEVVEDLTDLGLLEHFP
jgi:septum formation protein